MKVSLFLKVLLFWFGFGYFQLLINKIKNYLLKLSLLLKTRERLSIIFLIRISKGLALSLLLKTSESLSIIFLMRIRKGLVLSLLLKASEGLSFIFLIRMSKGICKGLVFLKWINECHGVVLNLELLLQYPAYCFFIHLSLQLLKR